MTRLSFYGLAILLAALCIAAYFELRSSEELSGKREYSVLQALELKYRGQYMAKRLLIERREGFCAVGILSSSGATRVWILLDPESKPYEKEMPERAYRISRGELDWLKTQCEINAVVLHSLEKHIQR